MQTNEQTAQREAGSAPAHGSTKVIVYAGKHYGQPHYVVGRHTNGRELIVWHVEDSPGKAFRVNVCDTETLSSNAEVSEVAVADSTKTCGVRPPLSLD